MMSGRTSHPRPFANAVTAIAVLAITVQSDGATLAARQPGGPLMWLRDYIQAQTVATTRNLPIVLVFSESGFSCLECRLLDGMLQSPDMQAYRDRGVFVWVDPHINLGSIPAAQLVRQFQVRMYPTIVVADEFPEGTGLWGTIEGYVNAHTSLKRLDEALALRASANLKDIRQMLQQKDAVFEMLKRVEATTAVEDFKKNGRLTFKNLVAVLGSLGYAPTQNLADGRSEYKLAVKEAEWQYDLRVALTANAEGMWIMSPLAPLNVATAPADALAALLAENTHIAPAAFSYDPSMQKIWLTQLVPNIGLTAAQLQGHFKSMMSTIRRTQPLWGVASRQQPKF